MESLIPPKIKKTYSLKHIRKAIYTDLAVLKKGIFGFSLRWWKRRKRFWDIKIFIKAGLIILMRPVLTYLERKNLKSKLGKKRQTPTDLILFPEIVINSFPEEISVIINTKNCPYFFETILKKYKYQKGFKKVEIIIVDSGSTDETLQLAKGFNCKIIEIKPEEFRHGRSRNVGIIEAKGNFIVNAVSDATPTSFDLLYKVATKLIESKSTAVSVRQIPRVDSDIFSNWNIWNHYQAMFNGSGDDIWVERVNSFGKLQPHEQRKLALVDDVFVLHQAATIKKELYDPNIRYAEDLDLSLRYIKKGLKIGFLNSEAVIHSHTREPHYFLKRYFVDTNVIYEVFGSLPENFVTENNKNEGIIVSDLISILTTFKHKLKSFDFDNTWLDQYLSFFGSDIVEHKENNLKWENFYNNIYDNFLNFANNIAVGDEVNKVVKAKLGSLVTGVLLSEYLIRTESKIKLEKISNFKKFMETGV